MRPKVNKTARVTFRAEPEVAAKLARFTDRCRVDVSTALRWVILDMPDDWVPSFMRVRAEDGRS